MCIENIVQRLANYGCLDFSSSASIMLANSHSQVWELELNISKLKSSRCRVNIFQDFKRIQWIISEVDDFSELSQNPEWEMREVGDY